MQELIIIHGSDQPTKIQILEENNGVETPFNLTGVSEITACFRKSDGTILQKLLSDAGIIIDNAEGGLFSIDWDESETALLKIAERQDFEVEIVKATKTNIIQFQKVLTVRPRICA